MAFFERQESPATFNNHRKYRPFLRKDFRFQCAYCERTEAFLGGQEAFDVEHFMPQSKFPDLVCSYANLYYACRGCNSHKSEKWPSSQQMEQGLRFADPCEEDPYSHHLRENNEGGVDAVTRCGDYTNDHIRLSRPDLRTWRRMRSQARQDLRLLYTTEQLLEQLDSHAGGGGQGDFSVLVQAVKNRIADLKLRFQIE